MKDHYERELKSGDFVMVPCQIQARQDGLVFIPVWSRSGSPMMIDPDYSIKAEQTFAVSIPAAS